MRTEVRLHIDGNYRVMRGEKIGGIVPKHTSIDKTSWVDFNSKITIFNENCLVVLRNGTKILNNSWVNIKPGALVTLSGVQTKKGNLHLAVEHRSELIEVSNVAVLSEATVWLFGDRGVHFSNSNITINSELKVEARSIVVSRVNLEGEGTKLKIYPGIRGNVLVSDVWLENTSSTKIDRIVGINKDVDLIITKIKEVDAAKGEKFTYLLEDDVILKNKCITRITGASDLVLKGVETYEKQDN